MPKVVPPPSDVLTITFKQKKHRMFSASGCTGFTSTVLGHFGFTSIRRCFFSRWMLPASFFLYLFLEPQIMQQRHLWDRAVSFFWLFKTTWGLHSRGRRAHSSGKCHHIMFSLVCAGCAANTSSLFHICFQSKNSWKPFSEVTGDVLSVAKTWTPPSQVDAVVFKGGGVSTLY